MISKEYLDENAENGPMLFQIVHDGKKSQTNWKLVSYSIKEVKYSEYEEEVERIQTDGGVLTSPDVSDKHQYKWQSTAVIWLADLVLLQHDDMAFRKLMVKLPLVNNF